MVTRWADVFTCSKDTPITRTVGSALRYQFHAIEGENQQLSPVRCPPCPVWPSHRSVLHPYQSGSLSPPTLYLWKRSPALHHEDWDTSVIERKYRNLLFYMKQDLNCPGPRKQELAGMKTFVSVSRWRTRRKLDTQWVTVKPTALQALCTRSDNKLDSGLVYALCMRECLKCVAALISQSGVQFAKKLFLGHNKDVFMTGLCWWS